MREIDHINNVLKKIVLDNYSFNMALRSSLKNEKRKNDSQFINTITAVCGGYLRHYYSLERVVKNHFSDDDVACQQMVEIILADKLFSKRLSLDDLFTTLNHKFPNKEKEYEEFVNQFSEPHQLIGDDIAYGSDEYIHLRYNLPMFLVKMWRKNCKHTLSNKLFKSLRKNEQRLFRINTSKMSVSDFHNKYNDLELLDDLFVVSKEKGKKLPYLFELDALDMKAGYTFALSDLEIDFMRGVAIYGSTSTNVLDEIYAQYGSYLKLDYLCGDQKHFFEVNNKIRRYSLSDISVYECHADAMRTCISKPVHTFIVSPSNSAFQKLSEESDYFLRISQDQLDGWIKEENLALDNAALLVEEGGDLVYIIPTLCRNETYGLISKFLDKHPEFSLIKENQLFPFDKYGSLLYFAVLKKEIKHD